MIACGYDQPRNSYAHEATFESTLGRPFAFQFSQAAVADEFAALFIPETEGERSQTGEEGQRLHTLEERQPLTFFSSRSEEHTSELQSLAYLVCRLLLEKKKKKKHQ